MRQEVYLLQKHGIALPDGSSLFWLADAIMVPEQSYTITCSVRNATFPVTHYVITASNNTLHLVYDGVTDSIIRLPVGNRSVDALVEFLTEELEFGFAVVYEEATNNLVFTSATSELEIGPETTCQILLGLRPGMSTSDGALFSDGIDLRGTSAYYIDSNLRTRNRNPVDRGFGTLLATVPITRAQNGIEIFTGDMSFPVADRIVNYIVIRILDDDMRIVKFNGGSWSITLEVDVDENRVFKVPRNFRDMLEDGSIGLDQGPAPGERTDEDRGRPVGGGAGDRRDPDQD